MSETRDHLEGRLKSLAHRLDKLETREEKAERAFREALAFKDKQLAALASEIHALSEAIRLLNMASAPKREMAEITGAPV